MAWLRSLSDGKAARAQIALGIAVGMCGPNGAEGPSALLPLPLVYEIRKLPWQAPVSHCRANEETSRRARSRCKLDLEHVRVACSRGMFR